MNENKHTPGPWSIEDAENNEMEILYNITTNDTMICGVYHDIASTKETSMSDALLIAAAPEMFDVIKELYEWANENNTFGSIYPKIEAIYKKVSKS